MLAVYYKQVSNERETVFADLNHFQANCIEECNGTVKKLQCRGKIYLEDVLNRRALLFSHQSRTCCRVRIPAPPLTLPFNWNYLHPDPNKHDAKPPEPEPIRWLSTSCLSKGQFHRCFNYVDTHGLTPVALFKKDPAWAGWFPCRAFLDSLYTAGFLLHSNQWLKKKSQETKKHFLDTFALSMEIYALLNNLYSLSILQQFLKQHILAE